MGRGERGGGGGGGVRGREGGREGGREEGGRYREMRKDGRVGEQTAINKKNTKRMAVLMKHMHVI